MYMWTLALSCCYMNKELWHHLLLRSYEEYLVVVNLGHTFCSRLFVFLKVLKGSSSFSYILPVTWGIIESTINNKMSVLVYNFHFIILEKTGDLIILDVIEMTVNMNSIFYAFWITNCGIINEPSLYPSLLWRMSEPCGFSKAISCFLQ